MQLWEKQFIDITIFIPIANHMEHVSHKNKIKSDFKLQFEYILTLLSRLLARQKKTKKFRNHDDTYYSINLWRIPIFV